MRRAFRPNSSSIPSHVVENYRQVVGMVIAMKGSLSVYSMSQLLGIAEDEFCAILNPISSIIHVPSNDVDVGFYHAMAKESIMGDPIGEEDKMFFSDDSEGYDVDVGFYHATAKEFIMGDPRLLPSRSHDFSEV
ncbi:uncharacterized protein EI90DRAFT_3042150 [Cantharellus anzutake]|uniref:uncharacterized protein n=1 Tax=Cantharellus anzutake TaxID=1750568 RepID=UPI0019038C10|nr:uncharacterized protein EI90DRAFT_3042150 [Cantharellus anzutake]KAF8338219.1 hypothetical protein EI90DRAFT_3042150 [Cantharellus anzutake]